MGSRILTVAGLATQLLGLVWLALVSAPDPQSRGTLLLAASAAVPLLPALLSARRTSGPWGKWVATLMVPYVCGHVVAAMTSEAYRLPAAALALLSVATFFLGLDTARRAGPARHP